MRSVLLKLKKKSITPLGRLDCDIVEMKLNSTV
jgi:hypothetical protein